MATKATDFKRLAASIVFLFFVFAVPMFLGAGTLTWAAGWIYIVLFIGFTIAISLWLARYNPELLGERMKGNIQAGQKTWDKILIGLVFIVFLGWLVVMGLDAIRFGWSNMPGWLQIVGGLILLGSFYLFFRTFAENTYLSPVVRVQEERGHTVISTGPYHYVRHPMYTAFVLFALGTSLLLGSWYGLLIGLILVIAVARRAIMEETVLREELQGYANYMTQVKYRFFPYLW